MDSCEWVGPRLLLCLRYGIGDVVMEMPALRHLRAQWPSAHLTALGARPATELLDGDPAVDALVAVQEFGFRHWGDRGDDSTRHAATEWVVANGFERVLDRDHTVSGMREILGRLGLPASSTGGGVQPWTPAGGGSGAHSILRSAVDAWGLDEPYAGATPRLRIPGDTAQAARRFLADHGLAGQERIGIAPVASSSLKRWPSERFVELVRRIAGARDCQILVFGVDSREPLADRLREITPERVTLVPPVHLQQTAALLGACGAVVANDTGLMHISAAMGAETVALFGPTSPGVVLPAGATAVSTDVPCGYRPTDRLGPPRCVLEDRCLVGEGSCIGTIGVETVLATVLARLDERAGRAPETEGESGWA